MGWNGLSRKAGDRVRVGRRTIIVPGVPSMVPPDGASGPADGAGRPTLIDHKPIQYLDRVRAIFRPTRSDALAPGLERFIGREDTFRHVGMADMGSDGAQPMMQCPSYWPDDTAWVPLRDLEVLEILEDQDVRAG